ncbi:MAG TPA: hypothetical protein VMS31_18995 [Pyrinomonadaceae bacterium]|nr:hypothetical protein [Pyrinomonadaceae bacterium]
MTRPLPPAWYFENAAGVDTANPETFELLQLTVNGKPRSIRRTVREGAQVYAVSLGKAGKDDEPITVAYTYRVIVQRLGHMLYLDLPWPSKGRIFASTTMVPPVSGSSTRSATLRVPNLLVTIKHPAQRQSKRSTSPSTAGSSRDREWRLCGCWRMNSMADPVKGHSFWIT